MTSHSTFSWSCSNHISRGRIELDCLQRHNHNTKLRRAGYFTRLLQNASNSHHLISPSSLQMLSFTHAPKLEDTLNASRNLSRPKSRRNAQKNNTKLAVFCLRWNRFAIKSSHFYFTRFRIVILQFRQLREFTGSFQCFISSVRKCTHQWFSFSMRLWMQ